MTDKNSATMTLGQIRAHNRGADIWEKLRLSLPGHTDDTVVSLGDIARSSGASDAWWCVRFLDWSDIAVRRAVVAALLPCVRRAAAHATDQRVHDCIGALSQWCGGDDTVDLQTAASAAANAASEASAAAAALWSAEAAAEAARAAAGKKLLAKMAADAAWTTTAAAISAAMRTATEADEHQRQKADLIAAFPPLHPEANGGCIVAKLYGPDGHGNARLIAAAPDLLDALKRCLFMLESSSMPWFVNNGGTLDAARAAIAKAMDQPA